MFKKIVMVFIFALMLAPGVSATATDTAFLCNIEGHPGDTITKTVTLVGTSSSDRIGCWETFYKEVEGDTEKMDITDLIAITPSNYTLKYDESKTFTVTIRIPKYIEPGLYGATSEDANMKGHSDERRSYIRFKDADASTVGAGGVAAWTGFRIPVSVKVLGKPVQPNPLEPIIKMIQANIMVIILLAIIVILIAVMLRRKKR